MSHTFQKAVRDAAETPEEYWGAIAQRVHWFRQYDKVLDTSKAPFYRWFPGGLFNTCYNALDVHVEQGRGQGGSDLRQPRGRHPAPHHVRRTAGRGGGVRGGAAEPRGGEGGLRPHLPADGAGGVCGHAGLRPHRRHPQRCVRWLCSGGAVQPDQRRHAKVPRHSQLRAADGGPRPAIQAHRGRRPPPGHPPARVLRRAADYLYVLYTSGTTGDPKGIVRDNAGHCVALKWTMDAIYGVEDDDVFWASSDIGWVVGHSYIIYAPLFRGITTVMYDGKPIGTPDAGAFWRVMAQYKVNIMFTAPTAFRALRKEDPDAKHIAPYDLSSLRAVYLAGERSDPGTLRWLQGILEKKLCRSHALVFDHYWQTETGWAIAGPCPGLSGGHAQLTVKFGSCHRPVPGFQVQEMDEDCEVPHPNPSKAGDETYPLAVRLPLPPGCFPTLFKSEQRFLDSYITPDGKYYKTGDAGYLDQDGFMYVMTRTDDVINVAGHRLATAAMEEIVASHPAVAECAVFGVPDHLKGQVPVGCVVLKDGAEALDVVEEACALVRQKMGAIACFTRCAVVPRLPKTRSGKILRKELSKIASGLPYAVPPTIDDASILPVLEGILRPPQPARL